MKLEEYLWQLKLSSDENLKSEWGVNDNFPIFLRADSVKILSYLNHSSLYLHSDKNNYFGVNREIYHFAQGKVKLQIFDFLSQWSHTIISPDNQTESTFHHNKQKENYNSTITLHILDPNKPAVTLEKIPSLLRPLAEAIDDICQWAITENIPLCLPLAGPERVSHKPKDYSQIIYFP